MKKKGLATLLLSICLLLILGTFPFMAISEEKALAPPKEFTMNVLPLGSLAYTLIIGMGEGMKQTTGIGIRVIPGGNDVVRLLPVRAKEVDLALITGMSAYYISHGLAEPFGNEEWGPQPVRVVWNGSSGATGYYVRGDSGIRKIEDLKGKRIAVVLGNPMYEVAQEALLSFAGLSFADVIKVVVPNSSAGAAGILQGTVDTMFLPFNGTAAHELAASRHGIWMIPLPKANVQGWKRLQRIAPFLSPLLGTAGAGPQFQKGATVEVSVFPYPVLTYNWATERIPYSFTKAVWESYDQYKTKHPELPSWNHECTLSYKTLSYPYHDGTVKFFKETKVWTSDMEAWQSKQVKLEAARLAEWDKAKKEAGEKKVKVGSPEFYKFWKNWLEERNLISYPEL